ncbi:DUF4499 domain-containing protein [archaeon]|nr:MAG: DUF4499 domain-containing protein [archaeon]
MEVIKNKLNNTNKAHLLLYAWHFLKVSNAEEVQFVYLDENGFRVSIRKGDRVSESSYLFTKEDQAENIEATVIKVLRRYERANWPGQGGNTITLWIWLALAALPYRSLPIVLRSSKAVVMKLVQSDQIGLTMFVITVVLHILEAFYVMYALYSVLTSVPALLSWALYAFIFGYPTTVRAVELAKVHRSVQNKAE